MRHFLGQGLFGSLVDFSIVGSGITDPVSIHDGYGGEGFVHDIIGNMIEKVDEFGRYGHVLPSLGGPGHTKIAVFGPSWGKERKRKTITRDLLLLLPTRRRI